MRPAAEAGPAHLHSPPVVFLAPVGAGAWPERAGTRPGHLLPPCLPPLLPGDATRLPRPSLTLPRLSLRPYPPLLPLPPATERSSSPPTPLPRPQPFQSLSDTPSSSAPTPSSSPPSQAPREALLRLHAIVFVLDRRRWSPSIRRRPSFPEHAEATTALHVSS